MGIFIRDIYVQPPDSVLTVKGLWTISVGVLFTTVVFFFYQLSTGFKTETCVYTTQDLSANFQDQARVVRHCADEIRRLQSNECLEQDDSWFQAFAGSSSYNNLYPSAAGSFVQGVQAGGAFSSIYYNGGAGVESWNIFMGVDALGTDESFVDLDVPEGNSIYEERVTSRRLRTQGGKLMEFEDPDMDAAPHLQVLSDSSICTKYPRVAPEYLNGLFKLFVQQRCGDDDTQSFYQTCGDDYISFFPDKDCLNTNMYLMSLDQNAEFNPIEFVLDNGIYGLVENYYINESPGSYEVETCSKQSYYSVVVAAIPLTQVAFGLFLLVAWKGTEALGMNSKLTEPAEDSSNPAIEI